MALELVNQLPYDHPYRWDGTAVGGQKLWRPDELGASLALWLDAEDTASITLNGSTVSQWGDKSGNGRNAVQATAANQPTYNSTAYNGKPVLQFDGTSDFLSVGTASLQNTGLNVFVVGNYTDLNYFIGKYESLSEQREWLVRSDRYLIQENLSPFNSAMAANGANQSGKHLIEGIFANGQAAEFWADGSIKGTAALAVNSIEQGTADLQIGKYQTVYSNSDISEVIATSAPITVADRQRLEGYLAHKWGLFANLPADHPYKVAAPTVAI